MLLLCFSAFLAFTSASTGFSETLSGTSNRTVVWNSFSVKYPTLNGALVSLKSQSTNNTFWVCAVQSTSKPDVTSDLNDFCNPLYLFNVTIGNQTESFEHVSYPYDVPSYNLVNSLGKDLDDVTFDLSPGNWWLGVEASSLASFRTVISGNYCTDGSVGFNDKCTTPAVVSIADKVTPVSKVPAKGLLWSFEVTDSVSYFSFDAQLLVSNKTFYGMNSENGMYIRLGAAPSETVYDAADIGGSQLEVFMNLPIPGTWYILLTNPMEKNITGTVTSSSASCGNSSTFGPNCTLTPVLLPQFTAAAEKVDWNGNYSDNGYTYFLMQNYNASYGSLRISVATSLLKLTEAPNMYYAFGNLPTSIHNDGSASGKYVKFLDISLSKEDLVEGTQPLLFIAVEASKSSKYFYVWTGDSCANNCSGNGECNTKTGLCDCDSNSKSIDCQEHSSESRGSVSTSTPSSHKPFPVRWIVIICILLAFILAIAIGVPVACYLRHRKKSRYERV